MKIIRPETEYWIQDKLDDQMMDYVWSQIKLAKNNHKDRLVGHIARSLALTDPENKFSPYLLELSKNLQYMYHPDFKVRDLWVNFQKKYDFNPMHHHRGAVSFVLWMKIPYEREVEAETEQVKGITKALKHKCGSFQFTYTSVLGLVHNYSYYLDPSWEGSLVMFPSSLEHQVYPFYTSDLERVSISGNIY